MILKWRRLLKMSVFVKLVFGYFLLAMPVYMIGLGVAWYGSKTVQAETGASMQEKLYFFTNYIEEELSNINQMLVSLNVDSDLMEYTQQRSSEFGFSNVVSFGELMSKLKILFYSSDYIDDVFMILPEANEVVTALRGYDEMGEKHRDILNYMDSNSSNRLLYDNKLIYFSDNGNDFILGVELSQDRILESLKLHQGSSEYHIYLKDREKGELLASDKLTMEELETIKRLTQGKEGSNSYIFKETDSKDGLFTIGFYIPEKELLGPFYFLRKLFWVLIVGSAIMIIGFSLFINRNIQVPLRTIVRSMREVERGHYGGRLELKKDDEFGYMYSQFNRMAEQLQNLIGEVLEKKIQVQMSILRNLQSQINPHFLYNCFYNGYRMAKSGKSEEVAQLCKYLGDYFRYVTYYADRDVTVADELKYAEVYLEIQKIRFPRKLRVDVQAEESVKKCRMPALLLQPLVENALIHGLERKEEPTNVSISIFLVDGYVRTVVEDDGAGIEPVRLEEIRRTLELSENESEHFGLWNIHWRLKLRYGEGGGLIVPKHAEKGFRIYFDIPAEIIEEEEGSDVSIINRG